MLDDTDNEVNDGRQPALKDKSATVVCLTTAGKRLHLQQLLAMKKFRHAGNKPMAVAAFYQLQKDQLGRVIEITNSKGIILVRSNHTFTTVLYVY